MKDEYIDASELDAIYSRIHDEISSRIEEFEQLWESGTEEELFNEFAFCLLTPQSKAKSCWIAVEKLRNNGLLLNAGSDVIAKKLAGVRFHYKKAANIERARELFIKNGKFDVRTSIMQFNNPFDTRDWLVQNVQGMGYKEASHFLRNIGHGEDFAILDRHIIRNLKCFKIIDEIPKYLTGKNYLDIEEKMRQFAYDIEIPMNHLDLLFWFKETGEIFK